jgi:hypothetical protein
MAASRGLSALGRHLRTRTPALYLAMRRVRYLGRREALDPTWERIARGLSPGDLAVQGGPFSGMRYLPFASGSGLLPKLAGSYEMELHAAVAESILRSPARLINIGAAEGYYAIGYALRLPGLAVHAFDTDVLARRRLRDLARLNGVRGRVRIRGRCCHRRLESTIVARTLIVCDCEGCESCLLNPVRAPRLRIADLVVELHVERQPAVADLLLSRFAPTHEATRLRMAARAAAAATFAGVLSRIAPADRGKALHEREERTEWLWLRSRQWGEPVVARIGEAV